MAKPEKELQVTEIADKLAKAEGVYLTDYKGLNVDEISELRGLLRDQSVEYKVVKNTLAKLSTDKAGMTGLKDHFTGPTAIAFCLADPMAGAKVLSEFQKKHKNLDLKIGFIDGKIYNEKRIAELAKLPPKEQIIAQTVGTIAGPLTGTLGVLSNLLAATVRVLGEIKKQKES